MNDTIHLPAGTHRERGPVSQMLVYQSTCACGWYSNWYVTFDRAKEAFFGHRNAPGVPATPGVPLRFPAA
jgi:hypothetical protein